MFFFKILIKLIEMSLKVKIQNFCPFNLALELHRLHNECNDSETIFGHKFENASGFLNGYDRSFIPKESYYIL